jgi:hypothetical protein
MRSRLKEECLDEAFQEIQARGCSNNKPESNTFRITVEKQAGRSYMQYDVSVSSSFQGALQRYQLNLIYYANQIELEIPAEL